MLKNWFEVINTNNVNEIKNESIKNIILNWPAVYLLNDSKKEEYYIGETNSVKRRLSEHNIKFPNLDVSNMLYIYESNASITYMIESYLIEYFNAIEGITLRNSKMQSKEVLWGRDFHKKNHFSARRDEVIEEIKRKNILPADVKVNQTLLSINRYKQLSNEQYKVYEHVYKNLVRGANSLIEGGAGTGKTILVVTIALSLIDKTNQKNSNYKIAIYTAKSNADIAYKENIKKLNKQDRARIKVINSLTELESQKYDFIFIDEGHKLKDRDRSQLSSLNNYYFNKNEDGQVIKIGENLNDLFKNDLDYLDSRGIKYAIFFDRNQSAGKTDIDINDIVNRKYNGRVIDTFKLSKQFRMIENSEVDEFIMDFLQINTKPENEVYFVSDSFELEVFSDEHNLVKWLHKKEAKSKNSRLVSPLSLCPWKSKDKIGSVEEIRNTSVKPDYTIGEYKFYWNINNNSHLSRWETNSVFNEMGSIHSVMGKGLKYVGVIIRKEDLYMKDGKVEVNVNKNWSAKVSGMSEKQKKRAILNHYYTLLTRCMLGLGVYIEDDSLRESFVLKKNKINASSEKRD